MKALYFAKIDYIKMRTQLYLILLIVVVVAMIMRITTDATGLVCYIYGVFIAIVFATTPFGTCSRKDAGFQQLLPATTLQRVLGRFMFGFSLLVAGTVIGLAAMEGYSLLTGLRETVPLFMCLATFAVGLVIITVQYIIIYLVGESKGAQFLSIVRMVPGMGFLFGSMKLMGAQQENPAAVLAVMERIGGNLDSIGWGSLLLALAVMAAGILLCTGVTAKKDY